MRPTRDFDFIAQATSRAMVATGPTEGPPMIERFPVADIGTGVHPCVGILAALWQRQVTHVDHVEGQVRCYEHTGGSRRSDRSSFDGGGGDVPASNDCARDGRRARASTVWARPNTWLSDQAIGLETNNLCPAAAKTRTEPKWHIGQNPHLRKQRQGFWDHRTRGLPSGNLAFGGVTLWKATTAEGAEGTHRNRHTSVYGDGSLGSNARNVAPARSSWRR